MSLFWSPAVHANIYSRAPVSRFTKYGSTPKSYYKSPLGNSNSVFLQSYFLSAILHQVQVKQHGNHNSERGDKYCNHTVERLHQHYNLVEFMRMFMAILLCLGWNPQRLPQQGDLCVWGDWDIGHRGPGGSLGQNVCDTSYKSMSTGLKITPRLIVASYIQSKTRSKAGEVQIQAV